MLPMFGSAAPPPASGPRKCASPFSVRACASPEPVSAAVVAPRSSSRAQRCTGAPLFPSAANTKKKKSIRTGDATAAIGITWSECRDLFAMPGFLCVKRLSHGIPNGVVVVVDDDRSCCSGRCCTCCSGRCCTLRVSAQRVDNGEVVGGHPHGGGHHRTTTRLNAQWTIARRK